MPRARTCSIVLIAALVGSAGIWAAEPTDSRRESFDVDPAWEGFRNRLLPETRPRVHQDFGYRATNYAGGARPGEIGGFVQRAPVAALYAKSIRPRSLDEPCSASGTLAVRSAEGASGLMLGWFRDTPPGWRTPNSIAMRLDGNGGKYWAFYEYGTSQWGTGGGGAFEGEQYQRTKTPPFAADGKPLRWSLDYDPSDAEGRGLLTFRIDGRVYRAQLAPGHRAQGATLNHFGIWNVQTPGQRIEAYFDDLTVDGVRETFDVDPHWDALGNDAQYLERILRPHHDFGFSPTRGAGGAAGEIGGIVFRDERPAYYAVPVGPLSLDDELVASGRMSLVKGASDSGVYIGWFDSASKRRNETPESSARQRNYLAVLIEGPSRVGHYFRPGYGTRDGGGTNAGEVAADGTRWPVVKPDGAAHQWSLHYRPERKDRAARVEVTFDGKPQWLEVAPEHQAVGATFDRFGIFNMQSGGHHVEIYLDDLTFTRRGS